MKKTISFLIVLSISFMLVMPTVISAPKIQLPERTTWDIDMINSNETGYTGEGVYVAVLDTGLVPNWKDYFPVDSIATDLGKGFKEIVVYDKKSNTYNETGLLIETTFIGSAGSSHGTHVASTILGYNYYATSDAAAGLRLPPIFVEGIAPDVTIIPVKVLSDYSLNQTKEVFGTSKAVAAGINYATDLAIAGYRPMIITMSLGGDELSSEEQLAIDRAIANDVIVVAAAGNEGDAGMSYPGAYQPVISVGACGWEYEWYWNDSAPPPRYRLWWLQDNTWGFNDVVEGAGLAFDVYITSWSSRELPGQDLDVVAPGSWVRGPYPGTPGYSHLPWWSNGLGDMRGRNPGNFYYLGGTSMATPHVTGVVALMLQKDMALNNKQDLTQSQVETILENTALKIVQGSMTIWDLSPTQDWYTYSWGTDATGKGLVQADAAVAAVLS